MKHSAKLKGLVAAVSLACAGAANAAVLSFNPSTGDSSFFFTSFDGVAGRSYGIELFQPGTPNDPLRMSELVALANGGAAFSLSFQLPNLAAFYGNFNNVQWGVVAADATRTNAAESNQAGTRLVQTGNPAGLGDAVSGSADNMQGLLQFTIGNSCANFAACTATSASDGTYLGNPLNWETSYGIPGGLSYSQAVASVNSSIQEMTLIEPDLSNPGIEGFVATINTQLMVNGAPVLAKLDFGNNLLTISASPIPVPAAVWLMGSALVGMGAAARRKQNI